MGQLKKITRVSAMRCGRKVGKHRCGEEFTIRHFTRMIYDFEGIRFDTDKYAGSGPKRPRVEKLSKIIPDISLRPPLLAQSIQ
ncbi:MAG: hypothetical protein ACLQBD_31230 [Syntrophobacteraceae bacterium]